VILYLPLLVLASSVLTLPRGCTRAGVRVHLRCYSGLACPRCSHGSVWCS